MIEIVQVLPLLNYDLILYFVDGRVKRYNDVLYRDGVEIKDPLERTAK